MSSSRNINALLEGSELGGVREMQRAPGQLTSSKGPERMGNSPRKTIGVVAYLTEKWSALLATTQKNGRIQISHEFETICESTPGFRSGTQADVFHEEELR
jgi:hypothetical protein